jgi:hypothetical protein
MDCVVRVGSRTTCSFESQNTDHGPKFHAELVADIATCTDMRAAGASGCVNGLAGSADALSRNRDGPRLRRPAHSNQSGHPRRPSFCLNRLPVGPAHRS